jgi:hypothetical protein
VKATLTALNENIRLYLYDLSAGKDFFLTRQKGTHIEKDSMTDYMKLKTYMYLLQHTNQQ